MIALLTALYACAIPDGARPDGSGELRSPRSQTTARIDDTTTWAGTGTDSGGAYGTAVAITDVDGDGYDDVLVGSPGYDSSSTYTDEGSVELYLGPVTAGAAYSARTRSNNNYLHYGAAIAAAGDVDHDSYEDYIVGGYGNDSSSSSSSQRGYAYLYYGDPSLVFSSTGLYPTSDDDAWFGGAVGGAGDVDADGYDDIVVGAFGYDVGATDGGAAFVHLGSSGGISSTADWYTVSSETSAYTGAAVAGVGDVDQDGYADLLVGAWGRDGSGTDLGAVALFLGGSTGLSATEDWSAEGEADGDKFGFAVAALGDTDADGYADFAVGAPNFDAATGDEGAVYVYLGASGASSVTLSTRLDGTTAGETLGWSVSGGRDFDDDGYLDLIAGAPYWTGGYSQEGAAYAWYGTTSGFPGTAAWSSNGRQDSAYAGSALATGDVDGDGYADALVGVPGYDISSADEGAAWLYSGVANDADGDGYLHESAGGTDCDDADSDTYPGAPEMCDGKDTACSGGIPTDETDADGDGYVECAVDADSWQGSEFVEGGGDCDDDNADVYPGATEYCNDVDDDCDGETDEDAEETDAWYADGDGDGYGDDGSEPVWNCDEPVGYADNDGDCDDGDATVSPAADEVCGDDTDNDCDGRTDDSSAVDASTWYPDADGDGYGATGSSTEACDAPDGYIGENSDCDDEDAQVNPSASEYCNDVDDDCDGEVDDDPVDAPTWYPDGDGDGYGKGEGTRFCDEPGEGWVEEGGDCRDRNAAINPGEEEVDDYDGIDQDCDGATEAVWVTGGRPWDCSTTPARGGLTWLAALGALTLAARRRHA